jgi:hypothetical protein
MRVWLTPRPVRFAHGKKTRYPLYSRLGEGPRPVWTGAKNLPPSPPECDPRTVEHVASRYTDDLYQSLRCHKALRFYTLLIFTIVQM